MTPQATTILAEVRAKVTAGTATQEELREALKIMREARGSSAATSPTGGSRVKKAAVDSNKLLDELDGL